MAVRTIIGLLAVVLLVACGAPDGDSWTNQARAWIDGYDEAFEAGEQEHQLYYARDAVFDGVMAEGAGT